MMKHKQITSITAIAVILALFGLGACAPAPAPAPVVEQVEVVVEVTRVVEVEGETIVEIEEIVITAIPEAVEEVEEPAGDVIDSDMEIKAALIIPGVHTDFGWNYVAFQALSNLKSMVPQVSRIDYTELAGPGDAEKIIRDYIAAGYNLIFVHGYQFKEGVDRVVAENPENVYVAITEGTEADLVEGYVSYVSPEGQEASYILGNLAAGVSNNGKVGIISGMESVDVVRNVAGFKAGVDAYEDGAQEVTMTVVGHWDDPGAGKKAAEAMMIAGVDVIYCMGDGTSIGVIQAVTEARAAGEDVYYIGYPSDQHAAFSDTVLSSIVYDFNDIFIQQANDVLLGNFGKQGYSITLGDGVDVAPYYQFEEDVPDDVKAKMMENEEAILKGDIIVPGK
jgi:basic membrane protein A and related proteins